MCPEEGARGTNKGNGSMKLTTDRPFANPEKAARKLLEIANSVEVVKDGRIYIELINGPFLYREKGTPAEYKAGLDLAVERGWLELHESGTSVELRTAGLDVLSRITKPQ